MSQSLNIYDIISLKDKQYKQSATKLINDLTLLISNYTFIVKILVVVIFEKKNMCYFRRNCIHGASSLMYNSILTHLSIFLRLHFQMYFYEWKFYIFTRIVLKFVPKGPIDNKPA